MIGTDYIDWIDMQELNNVQLDSCPVISDDVNDSEKLVFGK